MRYGRGWRGHWETAETIEAPGTAVYWALSGDLLGYTSDFAGLRTATVGDVITWAADRFGMLVYRCIVLRADDLAAPSAPGMRQYAHTHRAQALADGPDIRLRAPPLDPWLEQGLEGRLALPRLLGLAFDDE